MFSSARVLLFSRPKRAVLDDRCTMLYHMQPVICKSRSRFVNLADHDLSLHVHVKLWVQDRGFEKASSFKRRGSYEPTRPLSWPPLNRLMCSSLESLSHLPKLFLPRQETRLALPARCGERLLPLLPSHKPEPLDLDLEDVAINVGEAEVPAD